MKTYLTGLWVTTAPFLAAALLLLLWAGSAYLLRHKFPRYYDVVCWIYDRIPKVAAFVVVAALLYMLFTQPSIYE